MGLARWTRDSIRNWRLYEGSSAIRLKLFARNRFRAIVLLKGCCGHPGEPGC